MNLFDRAAADIQKISTDANGAGKLHALVAVDSDETCEVYGIHNKHHQKLDQETGMIVDAKNATSCISEAAILAVNPSYPIRNSNGSVSMIGHKVSVNDSTGTLCDYVVLRCLPDESVGLITLTLGDYKTA